jgi:hypothetical protein
MTFYLSPTQNPCLLQHGIKASLCVALLLAYSDLAAVHPYAAAAEQLLAFFLDPFPCSMKLPSM